LEKIFKNIDGKGIGIIDENNIAKNIDPNVFYFFGGILQMIKNCKLVLNR
jgi:hypothetical protein